MVDENNPLSFGNHVGYIANPPAADNEWTGKEKGPLWRPFHPEQPEYYSLAAASAPSVPLVPWASEIRAFLPRSPRR
jgi:hypothetical protein